MRAQFCRSASGTWARTPRSSTFTAWGGPYMLPERRRLTRGCSRPAGCCVRAGMRASRPPAAAPQRSPHSGASPQRTGTAVRIDDRRRFLIGFGLVLASPLIAQGAAAGKLPRVGFLHRGSPGPSQEIEAFQRGLRELGYIEGHNIAVEYRFAGGQVERLAELAVELVR